MKRQEKKLNGYLPGTAGDSVVIRIPSRRRFVKIVLSLSSTIALALAIVLSAKTSAQQNKESSCIACHSGLETRLSNPVQQFENDIHRARGLSCNDCHGGDPTQSDESAAKDLSKGYLGKPNINEIPIFCGKCHSDAALMKKFNPSLRVDQVQEYSTSVHGTLLRKGDKNVATCVSCHGVHGIKSPTDPMSSVYPLNVAETCAKCHASAEHMKDYKINHDQYDKYKMSVHAKTLYEKQDLSAPTCNDCHGNHGAAPPGITSVANVCGQCHNRQATLFQNSPHKPAFEKMQIAECLRCHNNHDIMPPNENLLGIGAGSVCASCHVADRGIFVADSMRTKLGELQTGINNAMEILERAEHAGMEVSRPKFELGEAKDALTQARVLVHTSSLDEINGAVGPGLEIAAKSYQSGEAAFAELNYRRSGLAVSLVFILFLALLVYLKLRQIESKQEAGAD